MRIAGLIWLRDVVDKLAWKHDVQIEEVEEVFENGPRFRLHEKGNVRGEDLYVAYGRTGAGRYLTVFFIHKQSSEALVITARDMERRERRRYASK